MGEAERNVQTVRIGRRFLTEASHLARLHQRSTGGQIEYWARLGRALEASPAFSAADVNAVLAGRMTIEQLNAFEQAAFVERIPETFHNPTADFVAAYADLSDDPETGTPPPPKTPPRTR